MIVDVLFGLRNLLVLVCSLCLRARRRLKIPSVARRDVLGDVCNGLPSHRWHNLLVYLSFPSIWIAVQKCFCPSQGRSVLCEAQWTSWGGLVCHSDACGAHSLLDHRVMRTLQQKHFIPGSRALYILPVAV
ncbi:hypothetical protein K456DRAFT_1075702 [Colletotrichum gloeosporioides 23]|nr:hypothetical protein K456DRAFT_1075702 [Colletotrichum gloeosporioides 23]